MVSRVSVKAIAIAMVDRAIAAGVGPVSKSSPFCRRWYKMCIFNATRRAFLNFFDPKETVALPLLGPASKLSSFGLLNLKKSSFALAVKVYFFEGLTSCSV